MLQNSRECCKEGQKKCNTAWSPHQGWWWIAYLWYTQNSR